VARAAPTRTKRVVHWTLLGAALGAFAAFIVFTVSLYEKTPGLLNDDNFDEAWPVTLLGAVFVAAVFAFGILVRTRTDSYRLEQDSPDDW
jgi:hypothetical protein